MHRTILLSSAAIVLVALTATASAESLVTPISFNNGIGQPTSDQPANGKTVTYQLTPEGGDLAGCTIDVVESLYSREDGAWGIFDIAGDVTCSAGGFSYTSSGAWDGNGFHAAGSIDEGSGSGDFDGIVGRIAQLNGGGSDAGNGTLDIAFDLIVDKAE